MAQADGNGACGPFGGGAVLADDQQQDGQFVLVVEVGDVVRPARGLPGVLRALGFDREEERSVVLGFDAQDGVDASFQRLGFGDVRGQDVGRGQWREWGALTIWVRSGLWLLVGRSGGGLQVVAAVAAVAGVAGAEGAVAAVAVLEGDDDDAAAFGLGEFLGSGQWGR